MCECGIAVMMPAAKCKHRQLCTIRIYRFASFTSGSEHIEEFAMWRSPDNSNNNNNIYRQQSIRLTALVHAAVILVDRLCGRKMVIASCSLCEKAQLRIVTRFAPSTPTTSPALEVVNGR